MRHPLLTALASALLILPLAARAADVKVLTAGAYKQVLLAAQPAFEQRTGHRLVIDNDTAGGLQRRIGAGEAFDVVVSSPASLQPVAARLAAEPPRPLARVGIGIAVKAGAPLPDIGSVDAFRALLLRARGVAMVDPAAGGTSGVYLFRVYEKLGVAEQVRAKAVLVPGGYSAEKVVGGQADVAIQQMSELLPVAGVTVVGPLPAEIQNYTVYAGAVSASAAQADAARQLLDALAAPAMEAVLRGKGMEAPK